MTGSASPAERWAEYLRGLGLADRARAAAYGPMRAVYFPQGQSTRAWTSMVQARLLHYEPGPSPGVADFCAPVLATLPELLAYVWGVERARAALGEYSRGQPSREILAVETAAGRRCRRKFARACGYRFAIAPLGGRDGLLRGSAAGGLFPWEVFLVFDQAKLRRFADRLRMKFALGEVRG